MDIIKDLLIALDKGVDFSCNNSPTCRAKVVNVMNGTTVLEVVEHPESYMQDYNVEHADKIGTTFTLPSQYAWNAIYF
jgi:hypothetical protein